MIDIQATIFAALKTVAIEKNGLEALEATLRDSFDEKTGCCIEDGLSKKFIAAVTTILTARGRVVVTGLGKSGHIGTKIAATLASTGTPSFFVHAAEANHGDLGMIGPHDVILALSWSGETVELKGILDHAARFRIPLIAITSGADSALGRQADVLLLLPKAEEACPYGLAPTTSTTMQLALGDAIAVALLEMRGFTASDFKIYHPGGKLGASLRHVRDIMHKGNAVPTVPLGTSIPQAIQVLAEKHFGCVAVLDRDGNLTGIVTDGDLARNIDRNLAHLFVEDVMTKKPKTITPDTLASAAIAILNDYKISALLVMEGTKPVGIVHFHDLLHIGAA